MQNKTYKRELSLVFSAILIWEIYNGNTQMVEIIIWPIISLIAASAGLHIYNGMQQPKSSGFTRGVRDQRSSEYPDRQNQYSDGRADK